MIARRMSKLDSSGIRKVFDLAQKMENPVDLSIGQPDFDVPPEVKKAAQRAIGSGLNRYTVTQGIPELRQAVMRSVFNGDPPFDWEIVITCGVSGALVLAFLVLIDPGAEVLIPDPYFVMYKHLASLCSGVPRFIDTYPDFILTAERLEQAVSSRSKVLVLNTPANPTGVALDQSQMDEVLEVAARHNLFVISDEIYSMFSYDFPSATIAGRYERGLLMNGFSKTHAMTGWRLGYAIGPRDVVGEMIKLQQFSFVCAPAPMQVAGVEALSVDTSEYREKYREKRDRICEGLKDTFELVKPTGAFYAFPRVPWGDDEEFVRKAIEKNLLVIPGRVFSERTSHFRISYAASMERIERGIEILNVLARG